MVRKAGRALFALALVLAAAACDDNPLAEDRDQAAYFRLNPADATVNAGASILVDAVVVNQFGAATNDAVTATPCDSKVTAAPDTSRTQYEFPERFRVTGVTLGVSCLVVSGGGISDTVRLRVVPASLRTTGIDTVFSGESKTASVQFLSATGQSVTGLTIANVRFTSLTTAQAVVDSLTGVVTARAPGTARIVTSLTGFGVTRVDTTTFVVRAGIFTGTVAQGTAGPTTGSVAIATFTQGAIPFDSDTQVRLLLNADVVRTHIVPGSPAGSIRVVLPFGLPAGTLNFEVTNIGPNQVAAVGTINLATGTPAADAQEPDESFATPKSMVPGDAFFGSVCCATNGRATNPGDDVEDVVRLTITEAGSYRVSLSWNDTSDHDFYVLNSTGGLLAALEGGVTANPETTVLTLTPGTYFLDAAVWTHTPIGNRVSTYMITVVKQ